ncbi:DMT family transporter [Roseovarius sp. D22-M7]|uniref:DMT family transporter n=1 Tax=Roseovarius sp. D22-M7 TaxID=3127116 RepID=UPI00300FDED8
MSIAATINSTVFRPLIARFAALSTAHIGVICAWTAVIIYASSNSIVSLLVSIGEAAPVESGRNAITYVNLLLLGSLLSIVPMGVMFRRDLTRANVRGLTLRHWGLLTLSALLSSAVTPGLFFYALANTSVTNIVLITRIEPPLFLLAAWIFLGEYFTRRALAAGLVALSGAIVMIGLRDGGGLGALGTGEWAAVAATLAYIASTLVTRTSLRDIPIGIFSVGRTIMGAAMYFGLVCMIVGPEAFRDIFSPVLWTWIWLYAGIVIVLAQVTWNMALKYARSDMLSLATSFSPLAAILIAMALLGETAGPGFLPGGALIVLAIFISRKSEPANLRVIRIWISWIAARPGPVAARQP